LTTKLERVYYDLDMAQRDEKGRFLKGCSLFGKTKGIKNGRKKTVPGLIRDALKVAEDALPQMFLDELKIANVMKQKALKGDVKAAGVYHDIRQDFTDRIYGKPNQPIGGTGEPIRLLLEEYRAILKDTG